MELGDEKNVTGGEGERRKARGDAASVCASVCGAQKGGEGPIKWKRKKEERRGDHQVGACTMGRTMPVVVENGVEWGPLVGDRERGICVVVVERGGGVGKSDSGWCVECMGGRLWWGCQLGPNALSAICYG